MYTSDLFREIIESLLLSPDAECILKGIIKGLDGEEMTDDLDDDF